MAFIGLLVVVALASVVQAKQIEINGFTMVCNPPLKFTTVSDKQACISKCTSQENCKAAVFDYNEGVTQNNCAVVSNKDKCGPTIAYLADPRRAFFVLYSNIDAAPLTQAAQMEVDPNVGALAPVTQGVKKSMTSFNGPFTIGEEPCFHVCKLHTGCNGYAYGGSMSKAAGSFCVLKAFTKPVGNDGKCIPMRAADGPKWNTLFFEKAAQAPKKKCA